MSLSAKLLLRLAIIPVFAIVLITTGAGALEPVNGGLKVAKSPSTLFGVEGMITDEVIIEFKSVTEARTAQTFDIYPGIAWERTMTYRPVGKFRITDGSTPFNVIARLKDHPNIVNVYPNYTRSIAKIPDDPYYQLQKEELAAARVPAAWDLETGSASVKVGVIDTGVDLTHPDLLPNLILPEINVREDGMTDIPDDSGHGTAVMGVIGGVGNNGIGVAGINWTVSILPIRAAGGPYLDCDLFDEVEGIDAAREAGVNVINLSIGGLGTISVEREAATAAYDAGIVICAAAGNANPGVYYKATGDLQTDWQNLYYPAALPEVIGVGAVTIDGTIADFSNYGEDILSVMAPGVDIVSTVPDYECYLYTGEGPPYGLASGTSFATPMVAGVAALILSHFPGLSPDDVRARIEGSATPMAGPDDNHNGVNDYYGYGILNAEGALSQSPTAGNQYMRVAMFQSPTFPGELVIMVKALVSLDGPPTIDWSFKDGSLSGSLTLNAVETRPGFYIGRFAPGDNGIINILVNAIHEGALVTPVRVSRTFSDE